MADHVCPWWYARLFDNPLRRLLHPPRKVLEPHVRPGMRVAEIGCGLGPFAVGLATLAGPEGRVYLVDLQERMLRSAVRRVARAGLAERVEARRCERDGLGLDDLAGTLDFAVAFWMAHEVPDREGFARQLHAALAPGGRLLVAEPAFHVEQGDFDRTLASAAAAGLEEVGRPRIRLSRTALLGRPG